MEPRLAPFGQNGGGNVKDVGDRAQAVATIMNKTPDVADPLQVGVRIKSCATGRTRRDK